MSYQALLFCPDEKTARVVTQVLTELDFMVEPCNETFAAVKKLMAQHFDAVVVDCDNEQNATLLFKSARNSAPNQNSLSVAVVEGQSGVAKAFRIGANLVLTKPINVEQSKGTLRVARGLLRKADATKPGSASTPSMPPVSANVERPPASPPLAARPVSPMPVRQATPVTQAADSAFEVEREEEPKPEATEAALLESMPDPLGATKTQLSPTFTSKELPWQPVAMATPSPESAVAPMKHERLSEPLSFGSTKNDSAGPAFGLGTAAAPAPAREPSFATSVPASQPSFSSSLEEDEEPSGGSGKKIVFAALAAMILAAAGYYGWPHLHKASSTPLAQTPAIEQPSTTQGAPTVTPAAPASAPVESPTATTTALPATHEQVIAPDTTHSVPGGPAAPVSSKPSPVTKISAEESVSEPKSETPTPSPAPLVVKNEQHATPKPPAADATQPAAPALGIASTPNDKAIAGLLTSTPARVPKPATETLKVSQGVSQGLLVKRVQPIYPPQALQMRVQGAVVLDATIGKDGSIVSVKQVSGEPILARAAVDAVKQWKYKPYYLNGEPVEITTQVTVNFRLP